MVAAESLSGATVWVATNGGTSKEYEDNDILDNQESATRYIEAVEGQDFWVVITLDQNIELLGQGIRLKVWVDGQLVATRTVHQDKIQRHGYTHVVKGFQCSETLRKDFCFAALRTEEDGQSDALLDAERVKHLGSITVELHHVQNFRDVEETIAKQSTKSFAQDFRSFDAISEKALKGRAVSHSVSLKDVPLKAPKGRRGAGNQRNIRTYTEFVDPWKRPAATYTIRYRSRDALKSMLIIPQSREPSPVRPATPPSMKEEEPGELGQIEADVIEVQNFEDSKDRTKFQTKRERDREQSPRRRKTRKNEEVTVIELDDDGEVISETIYKKVDAPDPTQTMAID
ncbi:hypothetical protein HII31_02430 [Pseudocercospora fuligena]|uniref:DUF7918 domain-containing protein n=1 Tax=Pseudocercospora fuligena TaxID=685502 RepID=A0A8H6VL26_9PEZI|nr:hypothetical protein HII31_02430 [Pseudocercospora fuligena]